jgi:Zn-dependent peptidase ImmA (M78 family)
MKGKIAAKRQAKKLLSDLQQKGDLRTCSGLAIDVESVASNLGIMVISYPFPDDISGVFFKKEGKLFLGVNQSESEVRRRFTIAHEIGHYILHPSEILHYDRPEAIHFRAKNVSSLQEVEANYFAAELLMPEGYIMSCIENGIRSVSELAKQFKVSDEAMSYRLMNLGLI